MQQCPRPRKYRSPFWFVDPSSYTPRGSSARVSTQTHRLDLTRLIVRGEDLQRNSRREKILRSAFTSANAKWPTRLVATRWRKERRFNSLSQEGKLFFEIFDIEPSSFDETSRVFLVGLQMSNKSWQGIKVCYPKYECTSIKWSVLAKAILVRWRKTRGSERSAYTASSINLWVLARRKWIKSARCRTCASNSFGIADRYLPWGVPSIHEITPKLPGYPGLRVIHERRPEFEVKFMAFHGELETVP